MEKQESAWGKEYGTRGRIWRGESAVDVGRYMASGRVLEEGCGNGKTLVPLLKRGYQVTGIDFSRNAIRLVEPLAGEYENLSLLEGDVRALPFQDQSFDAVVCNYVLTHLPEGGREKAVAEAWRVLREGGYIFGGDEVEENTFRRGSGVICHYFTVGELRHLFRHFSVEELEKKDEKRMFTKTKVLRSTIRLIGRKDAREHTG